MNGPKYVLRTLWNHRGKTVLSVLGIILAITSMMVISLAANKLKLIAGGYFRPFPEYAQIVQRGTSFIQLVPSNSFIDEAVVPAIETELGTPVIPVAIQPREAAGGASTFQYYWGMALPDVEPLWAGLGLQQGVWPQSPDEVVVGQSFMDESEVAIGGKMYRVAGVLNPALSFLDGITIMELGEFQTAVGDPASVSALFVPISSLSPGFSKSAFEQTFPGLDFLTLSDIDELRGGISQTIDSFSLTFSTIALLSSLCLLLTLSILSVLSRRKEVSVLLAIGASRRRVAGLIIAENLILIGVAVIIGLPVSVVTFATVMAAAQVQVGFREGFAAIFWHTLRLVPQETGPSFFIQVLGVVPLLGLFFSLVPAVLGVHLDVKQELNQTQG
jgi:ABC-type antimicrobial peptide transport system permease subunit